MLEKQIDIRTPSGLMKTFACVPERAGPHPVILFLMDAPGIREELRNMVRRLASVGYYVLLPNLYYRSQTEEIGNFIGAEGKAGRARLFELMATLTIGMVMEDVGALLQYARQDEAASTSRVACVGYCMSGRFAVNAAATFPDEVVAAASIYGTALVTDEADSPHRVGKIVRANLYFACAQTDHYAPPETIEALRVAFSEDQARVEVEIYPGVEHGFAFPERPAYDRPSAERHWERLFALFRDTLQNPPQTPGKA